jgi:hypothetical protein
MKTKKQDVTPGAMRKSRGKRKAADKSKKVKSRRRGRDEIPPVPGGLLVRGIPQLPAEDGK